MKPTEKETSPSFLVEPGIRKRAPDPFGWVFAALGILLVAGIPLVVAAIAFDISRAVVALLVATAALLVLATVGIAFRESIRRRFLKFTLQDAFWLTLASALFCALVVSKEEMMQIVLGVVFLGVVSLWYARPATWDSPKDYITQLIGNGMGVALIVCTLGGLVGAFVFTVIRGIGR